jgi:hypothetical protein
MANHLIKEVSKDGIVTKCGLTVKRGEATAWWREVLCEDCLPQSLRDTWQEASPRDTMTP